MYHLYDIYKEVREDADRRYEGSFWVSYTPLPFFYSLSRGMYQTIQRKTPRVVRETAVYSRDVVEDVLRTLQEYSKHCTQVSRVASKRFYCTVRDHVEQEELPALLEPIREHAARPLFHYMDELALFVESGEMVELYVVAKARVADHYFGRHVVMPCIRAAEGMVQYMIILPSTIVFPSREDVAVGADNFVDISTSSLLSVVDYVYSATEVIEQQWTLVQWNILGRGPYESLQEDRRLEIVHGIQQRRLILKSYFRLYEFMVTIQMQNEKLYRDLIRLYDTSGGVPLLPDDVEKNEHLKHVLQEWNESALPCWFYQNEIGGNWRQFLDEEIVRLERGYQHKLVNLKYDVVVVDEGRHQVDLDRMERLPVYWSKIGTQKVQRATWLYTGRNYDLVPYNPKAAEHLENSFIFFLANIEKEKQLLQNKMANIHVESTWTKAQPTLQVPKLSVPIDGHLVEFYSPQDIIQYKTLLAGRTPFTTRRRVYRGDPRMKSDGKKLLWWKEQMANPTPTIVPKCDHLVLVVHGIGDALRNIDLNVVQLRSIISCADNLRSMHQESVKCPLFYANDIKFSHSRVEFLPIEWHTKLHTTDGPDEGIRSITLPAISKLREFANETILDVLFFMSPNFHQIIIHQVTMEMNRVVALFRRRNPDFSGKVSIIAHSLGAIICFDILSNQGEGSVETNTNASFHVFANANTDYPKLQFEVQNLFTFGSPIGMFIKVRGQELLSTYRLPTCRRFFNIFHPYDPVAYRMEPLIDIRHVHHKPKIIPTFAGGLRYQYQAKLAVKELWKRMWSLKLNFENAVEAAIQRCGLLEHASKAAKTSNSLPGQKVLISSPTLEFPTYGSLCEGFPIDYSLQENELEITNEYLFALTAHVIYWGNRDASLFIAKQLLESNVAASPTGYMLDGTSTKSQSFIFDHS